MTSGSLAEKAMTTHSSTLAWEIPWAEEPGGLQSLGSRRVGHNWATSLSLSYFGEGNGNPLQCSCPENLRDGGAWWASVSGVTQSRTRLKQLSSSSSSGSLESSKTIHHPSWENRQWTPDLLFHAGVSPFLWTMSSSGCRTSSELLSYVLWLQRERVFSWLRHACQMW